MTHSVHNTIDTNRAQCTGTGAHTTPAKCERAIAITGKPIYISKNRMESLSTHIRRNIQCSFDCVHFLVSFWLNAAVLRCMLHLHVDLICKWFLFANTVHSVGKIEIYADVYAGN